MKYFSAFVVMLSVFSSPVASAQQARSFEQLQLLVKPGDTVSVTDAAGKLSQGRIAELSQSSLRLLVNGVARDLRESDVLEIKQRRSDTLANGAKNGALVGLGLGALAIIPFCAFADTGGTCVPFAAFGLGLYAACGAGIGVGIDAMIQRQQSIYLGRGRTSSASIRIAPVLGSGLRGVSISFSF